MKLRNVFLAAVAALVTSSVARADFAMFEAGEEFLFGYGMDKAGMGREYPDIRATEP